MNVIGEYISKWFDSRWTRPLSTASRPPPSDSATPSSRAWLSKSLSIYLSFYISIFLSIFQLSDKLSIYLSIYFIFTYRPIHDWLSPCLSIYPFIFPSTYPFIHLWFVSTCLFTELINSIQCLPIYQLSICYLYICIYIYISLSIVHLSVYLSINLSTNMYISTHLSFSIVPIYLSMCNNGK